MPAAAHTFDGSNAAIRDVIARVAHHQIHTLADGDYTNTDSVAAAQAAMQAVGIEWNYPWGVTLYGMLHVSEATGDKEVERFVVEHNQIVVRYYDWMRDLRARVGATREMRRMVRASPVRRLLVLGSLDNCGAMGAQLAETFVNHGVQPMPEQKAVAEMIADYISNKQARLPDGTLWRPNALGGTIWVDDLYMSCPFLVRWYKYTGERRYLDDAARQIINMAQRLQDEDGVWWHGYYQKEDDHAPVKWGRGNGWAMVSTVEVLSAMPEDHPDRAKLLDILRRQVEGIKPLQASDGMWRQVLDQPELWEETSCTAMFSYAIARAVKRGWIDPYNLTVARKAFAAVARHVTPDGVVIGACQGTGIGEDLEAYVERARLDDDQHGPGPVMLAGAELLLVERR
ncbi:MAG TPA: glycoside hydrolase family 88 protein [Verrucomicrobiae bacterium]|nr:glycoside hydrolase family 88 protein [Verrucomicrobiae bacterium]